MVRSEDRGRTRVLRLHRPEVRNALNPGLIDALGAALDAAAADDAVRSIVLTGDGDDFCAGADLKVLRSIDENGLDENLEDSRHFAALFKRIHRHDKPVVAAVRGNALAGGCGLACVCDLVVAAEDSRFGFTEARIGFVAAIVSRFLIDRVGPAVARELLLSARRFGAEEALRVGLVDQLAPDDAVLETAIERARQFHACAASSLRLTKRLLAELPGLDLDAALETAARLNAETRATDDCQEGIAAFFEKRKPRWVLEEE